ncbi:MFS transporter [Clostridium estertheticum]|uniref:MFS transporter n=1 Tax=Clostridium estertheticum TaxID=238834 RepID=UPI001C0D14C1|nr:MFS transporter [Clostridium estertheticum]MBU3215058.1 MFS transporter [Clostridium estertheticum]WAG55652.1 MFS transporter [Clostridium estertheticum]
MSKNTKTLSNIPCQRWFRIIPPIIIVYIVGFMDRTNISFAIAGGMSKELGMTASISGLAAGIFFIGFLFLQVPGGLLAERKSGKKLITYVVIVWGIIATLGGFVHNVNQLLIVRFLLGVSEGCVLPCLLTMLSHWFPNEEIGRANALCIMNVPIASIITGPLSGFILASYSWRYVFIIEGILSLSVLFVWLPMISDRPDDAKWISKEEKDYINQKMLEQQESVKGKISEKVGFKDIFQSKNMWKLVLLNLFYQTGIYGFSLWLPTTLKNLTNSGMAMVGILSIFPYIGTIIGLYVFANLSDKSKNRKKYIIIPILSFALCLYLSVLFKQHMWVSFAFLVGCGVFLQAAAGVFWTIPPTLFSGDMAAASRGIINALGNLGGFLGPYIVGWFIQKYNYDFAIYFLVCSLITAALITLSLPKKLGGTTKIKNKESVLNVKIS